MDCSSSESRYSSGVGSLRVKVRYFTTLRELAGIAEEEVQMDSDATLACLIEELTRRYGKTARDYLYNKGKGVDPAIYFLINGANSKTLSGTETNLKDGDVVAIIPPIGGG